MHNISKIPNPVKTVLILGRHVPHDLYDFLTNSYYEHGKTWNVTNALIHSRNDKAEGIIRKLGIPVISINQPIFSEALQQTLHRACLGYERILLLGVFEEIPDWFLEKNKNKIVSDIWKLPLIWMT